MSTIDLPKNFFYSDPDGGDVIVTQGNDSVLAYGNGTVIDPRYNDPEFVTIAAGASGTIVGSDGSLSFLSITTDSGGRARIFTGSGTCDLDLKSGGGYVFLGEAQTSATINGGYNDFLAGPSLTGGSFSVDLRDTGNNVVSAYAGDVMSYTVANFDTAAPASSPTTQGGAGDVLQFQDFKLNGTFATLGQINMNEIVQHGTFGGPGGTLYSEQTVFSLPDGTHITLMGIAGVPTANEVIIPHA